MIYHVYILKACDVDRYYIGQTQNINNRLDFHNSGRVKNTKPYIPWKLFASKQCSTRSEAIKLETKLKNLKSTARLLAYFGNTGFIRH
jgi:putative endonuclease